MIRSAAVLALLLAASPARPADVELRSPAVDRAIGGIRPAALRAHMAFLADDLLEGRGTGTRGHEIAARYVAAELAAAGLEPGAAGSWFQRVPLRRAETDPAASGVEIVGADGTRTLLRPYEDALIPGDFGGQSEVEAPVVFAGYAITAPEMGHDDYATIDARGKIVAFVSNAPARFSPTERAHYASTSEKLRNAAAHGAVGVLRLRMPADDKVFAWSAAIAMSRNTPSFAWLDRGQPFDIHPELRGGASVSPAATERLFAGAAVSFAEAAEKKTPSALAVRARIFRKATVTDLESPNVVGLLRGSDPRLKDEYVVFTAHLDHLGIGAPVNGDAIYNGAQDDASGCAALLELARAFAALPARPRRSLLFVAVTGEEAGLLGSSYFAQNPTVPVGAIAADLNIDGMDLYPIGALVGRGAEHSTLGRAFLAAASRLGLKTAPDPTPEQVYFVRSDQYSFVKRGVPSLFMDAVEPGEEMERAKAYLHERYHRPADDMSQPMDLEAAAQFTRAYFLVGYQVAQADLRPRWNKDDFFGTRFGSDLTRGR